MKNTNILFTAALSMAILMLFGSLVQESRAASFTVNSTLDIPDYDAGDGICQTINARQCTLRAAISEANALAGDDIIFLPAGTYLTTRSTFGDDANVGGDFDITSNITINGAGAGSTFIQAASSAGVATERVLHFVSGTSTVKGVTVRYGRHAGTAFGAGIYNGGTLTLTNSTVSDNSGAFAGGGIYNLGTLTLTNVISTGNQASLGAGIFNEYSSVIMLAQTGITNNATSFAEGGGIYNLGTMTVTDSTIRGNTAYGSRGGGIYSLSGGVISNSIVGTNHAGEGGGIFSVGTLTVTNSTVSGNSAEDYGGGGILSSGMLTMTNSTVNGNSGVFISGGGILISGVGNLNNTIVANSFSGGDCVGGSGATINAQYSLIEDGLGCVNGSKINNLTGDPLLGPLQDNGGPTLTHALLTGSPAIDKGSSFSLTTDQRGLLRPVDITSISNASDGADIGAFEAQAAACPTITLSPSSLPNGTVGSAYDQTITVEGSSDSFGFAVTGGSLPDGLTLSSDGVISGSPSAAGSFTFTITATNATGCAGSREYTISFSCPSITLSSAPLADGTVNSPYSQTISATGSDGGFGFTVTGGSLPAGLSLDLPGEISGTPTTAGTFNFTVTATNASGCTGSQDYSITVNSASVSFDPPTDLRIDNTGVNSVSLRWTDNSRTETGFIIQMCQNKRCSGNNVVVGQTDVNATTFLVTGLLPNRLYTFRVAAVNSAGELSGFSNSVTVKTLRL